MCVHVHIRSSKEGDREQKVSVCLSEALSQCHLVYPLPLGNWADQGSLGFFFFFLISTSGRNRGLEARGDQLGEDLEFTLEGASWCQGFLSPGTAESLP